MKPWGLALFAACFLLATFAQTHSNAYLGAKQKFDHIRRNALLRHPDREPTVFSAAEINAWINEGGIKPPAGVESVRFSSRPGIVTAIARIDFDRVKSGPASANPLMQIFSGVHEVRVVARASASAGVGEVHVISVSIDQVTVPRLVMQLFVQLYLAPKYGNKVGLDSTFRLPSRVYSAEVGANTLSLVQR